ncbi:ribosomal protein L7/L12 [Mesorhizobium retamae]|uniref:Ribosomal protein L7/L12 n=1 Tax=Mesorhizobium retamae TaxID=2912854 RepID=A0ABS9QK53_9HYPH|nr:ribosomal protein L7/L12 [Mesorhizobium sp. IRAMC:0171]MCG7507096.1 ribosomal protein L7/L12 [Mesorhizobium sp. IRAMC:0171]
MHKFKAGDRVECVKDEDGRGRGLNGSVIEVGDVYVKVDFGGDFPGHGHNGHCWYFYDADRKLKPVAPFKVGDKVVPKKGDKNDLFGHWMEFWAKDGESKPKFFYVTKVNNDDTNPYIHYSANPGGFGPQVTANNLELYVEPTLTIQAGRYYKTRDGRKVGPMRPSHSPNYAFVADVDCESERIFQSDGTHGSKYVPNDPNLNIVAEWEEPASNDNAPKFKVGDRVARPGHLDGTIVGIDGDRVRVDYGGHWGIWAWNLSEIDHYPQRLATIPSTPTATAIVCLIENGQPKPSDFPHVHPSTAAAAKEAERLAGKFKGKEFGVYELVSTVQKPAPVYEHEWQRLAVNGRKIEAIKVLRGITGMGLKPAKDAVEYFLAAA